MKRFRCSPHYSFAPPTQGRVSLIDSWVEGARGHARDCGHQTLAHAPRFFLRFERRHSQFRFRFSLAASCSSRAILLSPRTTAFSRSSGSCVGKTTKRSIRAQGQLFVSSGAFISLRGIYRRAEFPASERQSPCERSDSRSRNPGD